MAVCQSWRYVDTDIDVDSILPVGRDHRVWKLCWNKVGPGVLRCSVCEKALILCPSTAVRKLLAEAKDATPDVLYQLTTDSAPTVSEIAVRRLAELNTAPTSSVRDLWT